MSENSTKINSPGRNPRLPAMYWFQNPPEGLTLFLVLYTKKCQWAKCLGCSLPAQGSEEFIGFGDQFKQIDYVFNNLLSPDQEKSLTKIILSNNGSIFDERTFSTTALLYFVAQMNLHLPNVKILTIETRVEQVEIEELVVLNRALHESDNPANLEVAVGFEVFDDHIRNDIYRKGMSLEKFEKLAELLGKYGFALKCYFMLKPVAELSNDQAVADIHNAIAYLNDVSKRFKVRINMHLNPTYAAKGSILETQFNRGFYKPPTLFDTCRAALAAEKTDVSIFIGLNDEGLAVEGGSFLTPGEKHMVEPMEQFNRTQDFNILKNIVYPPNK